MPTKVSGGRPASKMTSPIKLPPPVKSILRQSSVLGRRKADDDRDAEAEALTEQKRRRVLFDEIGNSVHDITQGDARRQVLKALEEHNKGDLDDYQKLLECFGFGDGDEAPSLKFQEMPAYIVALANNAHLFKHKDHNHLVNSIIHMPWLGRDEPFLKAYMQFLASVLTTQNSRLGTVLQMLVGKFHDSHSSSWDLPDYPPIDRQTMRSRLHTCLQYMLRLFPAAAPILHNTISNSLPYADSPVSEHVAYVDNLLRLREYASDLDDNIMDLILSHVVKIDVQMQVDLEDVDDDVSAAVAYLLKTADLTVEWEDRMDDEGDDDAESVDSADSDRDPKAEKIKFVKRSVDKMDAILDILFSLYARQFTKPDSPDSMACFATLIRQFTDIILPTYKSRHTQFLLFHISQLSNQLVDAFCGTCISIAFQSTKPNVIRQAAAAYLASFVARGANLGSETVRTAFTVLLRHAESLRATYEPDCRGPNIKRYHTYYALCQAVFYIFCFRWRDLVMSNDEAVEADDPLSYLGQDLDWLPEMKELLSRNIYSKLNPVKVCAPSIVDEFAKMAHRLNLLYIFPLLASNKRVRLTQFISDTYMNGTALRDTGELGQEESYHQLDPYFPFDPYQLPVSKRWLDSDYLDWQPITGLNQGENDDESDDVDVDAAEDAIEDEETATDSEEEDD